MRDPYESLGVPRGRQDAAIKSAYRSLTRSIHTMPTRTIRNTRRAFPRLNTRPTRSLATRTRKAVDRGENRCRGQDALSGL